jgi:hypothetical protein
MSTLNLNVDDCSESHFPIDLIKTGNKIYNNLVNIAETTAGLLILIPVFVASIIVVPITYIVICIVFTYYLFRIKHKVSKIINNTITNDNYRKSYKMLLSSRECLSDFKNIEEKSKIGAKGKLVHPLLFFIRKFHFEIKKLNSYLEDQLFESNEALKIPAEDIKFLKNQLNKTDHDWDNDELWADFQAEHHQYIPN